MEVKVTTEEPVERKVTITLEMTESETILLEGFLGATSVAERKRIIQNSARMDGLCFTEADLSKGAALLSKLYFTLSGASTDFEFRPIRN